MRVLYSLVFYAMMPLVILRLLWRGQKAPAYRQRWGERFGIVAEDLCAKGESAQRRVIWLHAVSVGESVAALPLIRELLARYPDHRLLVTTSTPTGSAQVKSSLGNSVWHSYAPYDLPDCIARFLTATNPELCIIMETELWPNTVAACHKRGIPVVLANARLSEKSARGYRRFEALSEEMLGHLSFVASQHEDDKQRFVGLGLPAERATVTGNIKFDIERDEALLQSANKLRKQWSNGGERLIVLAASTHRGEDEQVLSAFKRARKNTPKSLLVLVPRHPERFPEVLNLARSEFTHVSQRSLGQDVLQENEQHQDVVVADTMGEMMLLLGASDLVFVGGSLVPNGGHNMIEPAHWGLPIITGPSLFNFAEASRLLLQAEAMSLVDNDSELADELCRLCENAELRQEMGTRALAVADSNRGALEKLLGVLAGQLPG